MDTSQKTIAIISRWFEQACLPEEQKTSKIEMKSVSDEERIAQIKERLLSLSLHVRDLAEQRSDIDFIMEELIKENCKLEEELASLEKNNDDV